MSAGVTTSPAAAALPAWRDPAAWRKRRIFSPF